MKHLLVVQGAPTQFDVPLYNYLATVAGFELTVVYTQTGNRAGVNYDPEIGRAPQWDHVTSEVYQRYDLSSTEARRPHQVASLIIDRKPDLVLISGYFPPLHRKLVRPLKKAGLKVGLRSDNTLQHSNFRGIKGLVKKLVLPLWLRRYDSWHPVGSLAGSYLQHVSAIQRPIYFFPYNVDNDWFSHRSQQCAEQRQALLQGMGFTTDNYVVLGVLKWHQREDPLILIRAFRRLVAGNSRARLVLAGDGPLRAEVLQMLHGMEDKVYLPGYVPYSRLPELYAVADIFVHPAPREPWGVSVNEALACGVPVLLSSGVGAGKDLVETGRNGWIFPVGDCNALSQRLIELSRLPGDRPTMQEICQTSMHNWSYVQTARAFSRALNSEL